MINPDRYLLLYESNRTGANLAPVDFAKMQEFETCYGLDVSDQPTPEVMRHRITARYKGKTKTPDLVIQLLSDEVKRTSQNAISRATGLPLKSVQKYLLGITEPTSSSLQRLANHFKVTFTIEIKPEDV